ncbi:MAG TPA: hypothetical protein VHE61_05285 [Opitutaceae bacterium]|nr:hypothetical protein [Opitutaceae bacterium]
MPVASLLKERRGNPPPALTWSELDIAMIALELSREFRSTSPAGVARALGTAARSIPPREGAVAVAHLARRILQGPALIPVRPATTLLRRPVARVA